MLQISEIELDNLRSEVERLENGHLALTEKLNEANNEIDRL